MLKLISTRKSSAQKAKKIIGAKKTFFLDFKDNQLDSYPLLKIKEQNNQDLESAIIVAGNNVKLGKELIRGILEKTGIKTGIQNLIKEMIDMANQLLIDKGLFTSHIEKFSTLIQNRRK